MDGSIQGDSGFAPQGSEDFEGKEQLREFGSRAYEHALKRADAYRGEFFEKVRGFADALEQLAAGTDGKQGYEPWARFASQWVNRFAESFEEKKADELFASAKEQLRARPAVVIGSLALLGFFGARILRR
jgi:hypothetical protein